MKKILGQLSDSFRLMVGVGNYQHYRAHMREHHAKLPVMSETDYFRYCQNSRYPSDSNRRLNKCPC